MFSYNHKYYTIRPHNYRYLCTFIVKVEAFSPYRFHFLPKHNCILYEVTFVRFPSKKKHLTDWKILCYKYFLENSWWKASMGHYWNGLVKGFSFVFILKVCYLRNWTILGLWLIIYSTKWRLKTHQQRYLVH